MIYFVDRVSRYKFLLINNSTHVFMYLFISSLFTCFEHRIAHHQEIGLY